ncbi:Type III restriction-modification system methylation subunit [Enhygromyxa salina]|uniref:site-specific DNA-methyltransferase (adenine-specific) n=1 Tax=Enhygromyxa salina TaxID=215803 RepID=A0A0C1Z3S0_9BACT|nr:site-specific DNA-methyltransferase [Enhygromyxa salina]KIG12274.1 Type III restriction-modification system methylation subunit [Enhygromyxa salina]
MGDDDRVELCWPGKYVDGVRAPLLDHGAELLERERIGTAAPEASPANRLIRGDNLLALEALVRREPHSVDLVYIDPPFATGNRFALLRRIGDKREGTDAQLRLPAFDDAWDGGLAGFLRMLDPRLRLIHKLLSPTGSLYVHVDPTVGHAVKLLLDEVFGPGCFQREIVWRIGWISGFKTMARNWIRNHDLIFFYTKDPREFTFNKTWVPHPASYERRAGTAAKAPGVAIEDVWNAGAGELELSGRESLDSIQIKSFSREKTGWATQKNESLLRRIIAASSNPGDVVADLFAGSGTTGVVAAELGRAFVVCDHADAAVQIARNRLIAAKVGFALLEVDHREQALQLQDLEPGVVQGWMLEQLGGSGEGPAPFIARRGDVGLALGLPGEPVTVARIEQLLAAARERELAAVELLAFEWAAEELELASTDPKRAELRGPKLIPVQVSRGLFESSVRATAWVEGGVAVFERPELRLEVTELEHARTRIELLDVHLHRPEHLPESLRSRGFAERLLGWSIAAAATPTEPMFVAVRDRAGLSLVAELPGRVGDAILAIEDVCGHRHVRRLTPP